MRDYLATLGNDILDYLDIGQAYFQQELTKDNFYFYDSAKRNEEVSTLHAGHYFTVAVVGILVLSVLIATIIEIFEIKKKSLVASQAINNEELQLNQRRPTCIEMYFKAFRLIENTKKLLFARSRDGDKNMELLNGLRVISMGWVILGHTYFYGLKTPLANPLIPLELFKSFSFNIVSSGPYAVDIFFWLSGFLGVYLIL